MTIRDATRLQPRDYPCAFSIFAGTYDFRTDRVTVMKGFVLEINIK